LLIGRWLCNIQLQIVPAYPERDQGQRYLRKIIEKWDKNGTTWDNDCWLPLDKYSSSVGTNKVMKENNCYGHLYLRENLSFQNNYIIKELKISNINISNIQRASVETLTTKNEKLSSYNKNNKKPDCVPLG
jgi:predicted DNA-binding protein YlxM (UPF0122 family)